MTVYCDSSALFKLYAVEPHTAEVQARVKAATTIVTSTLTTVEIRAAFSRLYREHRITRGGHEASKRQFAEDLHSFLQIRVDDGIIATAAGLAERHGLRALDSIHLASFQQVLERSDDDVEFMSFDDRLNRAAKKLS